MIVDKFNKDYAKGNKNINKIIEDVVADFFQKEKVTEDSLRQLKQAVSKAVEDYRRDNKSCRSMIIQKNKNSPPHPNRKLSRETLMIRKARLPPKNQKKPASRMGSRTSSHRDQGVPQKQGNPSII
jgi:hypothetical protein